jgi:RNA polymerase sigma factor (sigma-70 family)
MINESLMLLRRHKHTNPSGLDVLRFRDEPAAPPVDSTSLLERKRLLEQAIASLPRNYRAVYMLREVQQLSTTQTAECLGISVDTVKVQLHRARERLKTELLETAAGAEPFAYPAQHCDPMAARGLAAIGNTR